MLCLSWCSDKDVYATAKRIDKQARSQRAGGRSVQYDSSGKAFVADSAGMPSLPAVDHSKVRPCEQSDVSVTPHTVGRTVLSHPPRTLPPAIAGLTAPLLSTR